jgi:hypothetical protein
VHSTGKGNGEVQLVGFASLPDILAVLFHDLAIEE